MSETLVERVARAIQDDMDPDASWWHMTQLRRDDFRGHARAAIAAMREPTEAMVCEGVINIDCQEVLTPAPAPIWHAMIDAALKEDGT